MKQQDRQDRMNGLKAWENLTVRMYGFSKDGQQERK